MWAGRSAGGVWSDPFLGRPHTSILFTHTIKTTSFLYRTLFYPFRKRHCDPLTWSALPTQQGTYEKDGDALRLYPRVRKEDAHLLFCSINIDRSATKLQQDGAIMHSWVSRSTLPGRLATHLRQELATCSPGTYAIGSAAGPKAVSILMEGLSIARTAIRNMGGESHVRVAKRKASHARMQDANGLPGGERMAMGGDIWDLYLVIQQTSSAGDGRHAAQQVGIKPYHRRPTHAGKEDEGMAGAANKWLL
eukprot:364743-Chlamydomonas_euryale.AAC.45